MNLQMPIRLIATDMDGTLLTDEPLILPETADVLRRAAEKGIVLSLASGRLPDDASFFAVDAKLPELVTALTGGLLGSDAAERNAAQIRQWVAPAHEG